MTKTKQQSSKPDSRSVIKEIFFSTYFVLLNFQQTLQWCIILDFKMNLILVYYSVAEIRDIVNFLCSSFFSDSESFNLAQENGSVELYNFRLWLPTMEQHLWCVWVITYTFLRVLSWFARNKVQILSWFLMLMLQHLNVKCQ